MRKYLDYGLILLIFAITGSSAAYLGKPLMNLLRITPEATGAFWWWVIYFLLITPIYQVLLLVYAWVFGKYHYFLDKQKRLFRRLVPARKQADV